MPRLESRLLQCRRVITTAVSKIRDGLVIRKEKPVDYATRQPDPRVSAKSLGSFSVNDKEYVIHNHPGCPRNAIIEVFDGYLRCWSCRKPLTDEARDFVLARAQKTDTGDFVWNKPV